MVSNVATGYAALVNHLITLLASDIGSFSGTGAVGARWRATQTAPDNTALKNKH